MRSFKISVSKSLRSFLGHIFEEQVHKVLIAGKETRGAWNLTFVGSGSTTVHHQFPEMLSAERWFANIEECIDLRRDPIGHQNVVQAGS
jgi:hypothetical protein